MLNSENINTAPVPETTFLKNKEIKLKIRSDDVKDGSKVDLIIQATKEVEATERKIDRYSPAFNSEFSLNNESPGDLKSGLTLSRNWDASRQDSHMHYPMGGTELFPLLMLRQILQSPHPLLGQNQFGPSQNLRHFEDNLHREIMPFQQGWEPANKLPMHLIVSQPIFTRPASFNALNQQHPPQAPHLLNVFPNGLPQNIEAQNYNLPPNNHQANTLTQHLPFSQDSLNSAAPQSGYLTNNHNYPKNNGVLNASPLQHVAKSQLLNPSFKNNVPALQSVPNALGNNKTPYPINNQVGYTLQRNLENSNNPVQKQIHPQPTLPYQTDSLQTIPKLHDRGTQNYQQNREAQLANYKHTITQQPNQNPYHNSQQRPLHHHHQLYHQQPLPGVHSPNLNPYSNNQQYSNHQINIPQTDLRKNTLGENYRPFLRESPLQSQSLTNQNQYHLHHEHSSPQSSQNDYRNHGLSNEPINKRPEDNKKVPIYYRSPEGSRPLYYKPQSHESPDSEKYHTTTEQSYSRSSSLSSSSNPNKHHYSEPETAHRNIYQEPSYGSHTRSSSVGIKDSVNQSDEIINPERSKYDESYISSKPLKKRKPRKKKRYETKENIDDLDGHSSHQYIIKIG